MTNTNTPAIQEKPLTATQIKNLREVVEGDFRDLRETVQLQIDKMHNAKKRAIEERFARTADVEAARTELTALVREMQDQAKDRVAEIAAKYPDLSIDPFNIGTYDLYNGVKVAGKKELLNRVQEARNTLYNHASLVLNREHRRMQRTILLQGVTALAASDLLSDVPDMADVLTLVESELDAESGDLIKELTE